MVSCRYCVSVLSPTVCRARPRSAVLPPRPNSSAMKAKIDAGHSWRFDAPFPRGATALDAVERCRGPKPTSRPPGRLGGGRIDRQRSRYRTSRTGNSAPVRGTILPAIVVGHSQATGRGPAAAMPPPQHKVNCHRNLGSLRGRTGPVR